MRVLCVAEKPDHAKRIAKMLSQNTCQREATGNKYIGNFRFNYTLNQQTVIMTMTSVSGHITELYFPDPYEKNWDSCEPEVLFQLPMAERVPEKNREIANNLRNEARRSDMLVIWTDCDREGEAIGGSIARICRESNPNIRIRRARFSDMNPSSIHRAAQNTVELDDRQYQAVLTRQECDRRTGYAFTRFLTKRLRQIVGEKLLSYGSCQFPTLGFVVDRYLARENFIPEEFWKIDVTHIENGPNGTIKTSFNWERVKCFDRHTCYVLYDQCVHNPEASVTKVTRKVTTKRKPLPLTTVELQKVGTRQLGLSGNDIMNIAEQLYLDGKISYPRTETDQFDDNFQYEHFINMQKQDNVWGSYAESLTNGGFEIPRKGKHNDKAHPPIHPTAFGGGLTGNPRRVYELITRRFLGCCSKDAVGNETVVNIAIACERFTAKGLIIVARNYLDIYTYDFWNAQQISNFEENQRFTPSELFMKPGYTERPKLLVEADLIGLMEKNGIGTDATISEIIKKVLDRQYIYKTNGKYFVPSTLGIALAEGYEKIGFEHSLTKPGLRQMMEMDLKAICQGTKTKDSVLELVLANYQMMYRQSRADFNKISDAFGRLYDETEDNRRSHGRGIFIRDGLEESSSNDNSNDDHDGGGGGRGRERGRGRGTSSSTRGRGRGRGGTASTSASTSTSSSSSITTTTRGRGRGRGRANSTSTSTRGSKGGSSSNITNRNNNNNNNNNTFIIKR